MIDQTRWLPSSARHNGCSGYISFWPTLMYACHSASSESSNARAAMLSLCASKDTYPLKNGIAVQPVGLPWKRGAAGPSSGRTAKAKLVIRWSCVKLCGALCRVLHEGQLRFRRLRIGLEKACAPCAPLPSPAACHTLRHPRINFLQPRSIREHCPTHAPDTRSFTGNTSFAASH